MGLGFESLRGHQFEWRILVIARIFLYLFIRKLDIYEIEIETPKGIIKFNIENLDNLEKYLNKYPDDTGIKAKRLVKERNK